MHDLLLGVVLLGLLVPITLIDLERRVIPNRLTGAGALAALAITAATGLSELPTQLAAGAGAGGFLLIAALARPDGMGMGDVKLAGMLGLFLGWPVVVALLAALLTATLAGAVVMLRHGIAVARRTTVPFGPFLALGAVVALAAERV